MVPKNKTKEKSAACASYNDWVIIIIIIIICWQDLHTKSDHDKYQYKQTTAKQWRNQKEHNNKNLDYQ